MSVSRLDKVCEMLNRLMHSGFFDDQEPGNKNTLYDIRVEAYAARAEQQDMAKRLVELSVFAGHTNECLHTRTRDDFCPSGCDCGYLEAMERVKERTGEERE